MAKTPVISATLLTLLIFTAGCPPAGPQPVEPPVIEHVETVSFHDRCAEILSSYVDQAGMVDYKALKRKRSELKALLDEFNRLDVNTYNGWSEEEKIAFWLNAYNVQLLKIIIDNYPIKASRVFMVFWPPTSIRHVDKRIGGITRQKFLVMDEEFTLREIEQRFFRDRFDEPRVFLGLSQASISGPPLRNEPYRGQMLYEQLDDQARKFLSSRRAFRIDREKKTVYLSAIFRPKWYGNEFISKYGTNRKFKDQPQAARAVLNFLTGYISRQDVSFLEVRNYSVRYIGYDWRLNE